MTKDSTVHRAPTRRIATFFGRRQPGDFARFPRVGMALGSTSSVNPGPPRRRVLGLAVGATLLLAACAPTATAGAPTAAPTPIVTVVPTPAVTPVATGSLTIQNFAFNPAAIVVPVGSTVTWTNQDLEEHTVTARDKTFDSDVVGNGKAYSFTLTKAGTYNYFCSIHTYMTGKVVVVAH